MDQLRIAQGWVRCGKCQAVYKAYDTLTLDAEKTVENNTPEIAPKPPSKRVQKLQRINELIAAKKAQTQQQILSPELTVNKGLFLEAPDLWAINPDTEIYYENPEIKSTKKATEATESPLTKSTPKKPPKSAPVVKDAKEKITSNAAVPFKEESSHAPNTLKDTPELREKLKRLERRRKKILEYRKKKIEKTKKAQEKKVAESAPTNNSSNIQTKTDTVQHIAFIAHEAPIEELIQSETVAPIQDAAPEASQHTESNLKPEMEIENSTAEEIPQDTNTKIEKNIEAIQDTTIETNEKTENVETNPVVETETIEDNEAEETTSENLEPDEESVPLAEVATEIVQKTAEELSFIQKAQRRAFWAQPLVRIVLLGCILLACCSLAAQILYHWRSAIYAQVPVSRGVFNAICNTTGCHISPWQNISAVTIENSYFRKLEPTGYRLGVTLRNTSRHRIAMPSLELVLLDHNEQILARRIIANLPAPSSLPPRGEWTGAVVLDIKNTPDLQQRGLAGYRVAVVYISTPS